MAGDCFPILPPLTISNTLTLGPRMLTKETTVEIFCFLTCPTSKACGTPPRETVTT